MQLANRRVLVIGGASGIGLGVARIAVERGATVVLAGRSRARLDAAATSLARPEQVSVEELDIANESAVRALFSTRQDPFDHVVVTAAHAYIRPIASLPLDEARKVLDVKVLAALAVAKYGRWRANGSLTLTAGINQARPMRGVSAVAAANGALVALGRALARHQTKSGKKMMRPHIGDFTSGDAPLQKIQIVLTTRRAQTLLHS